MFSHLCLVVFALSSLAASDPDCEDLLKPLEDRNQISGKWIFQIGATDNEDFMKSLKYFSSSWIDIPTLPRDNITIRFGDRHEGKCFYEYANLTYEGNNTKLTFQPNSTSHNVVGMHLQTCADCLLWADIAAPKDNGEITKGRFFQLFTRTGVLADSDLEVYKKQAACFKTTLDFYVPETTNQCPDEKEATEEEQ